MIRRAALCVLAVGWLGVASRAGAEPQEDAVALLPLDADRSLEIYGQPVASEIARALVAGSVPVVVVGPRMAVPERARLIVDGTIALGKASAVTISLRIRNRLDGLVLDTLAATAPGLAKIDGAAAELSARMLPLVQARLAAFHAPAPAPDDHGRVHGAPPPPRLQARDMLVAIADARRPPVPDALRGALEAAVVDWAHAYHRKVRTVDAATLDAKVAARTVATSGAELAIGFWVVGYQPEAGPLPMARARVRVRITDATSVVFDRVVVTDTVLGDKGLGAAGLAARVARAVLEIVRPQVARSVPSWP